MAFAFSIDFFPSQWFFCIKSQNNHPTNQECLPDSLRLESTEVTSQVCSSIWKREWKNQDGDFFFSVVQPICRVYIMVQENVNQLSVLNIFLCVLIANFVLPSHCWDGLFECNSSSKCTLPSQTEQKESVHSLCHTSPLLYHDIQNSHTVYSFYGYKR